MKKILFQGDSITDAGRARDNNVNVGRGYPHLVKAFLGYREPDCYQFINRGISGNRIVDVYARIKIDITNLSPDFMSMLIGINDVWHEFGSKNGVSAEKFEKIYSMLIEEIRQELPDVKILIMEPFVLPACATEGVLEDGSDKYAAFRRETELRAAASRRIAEKYSLGFLPLQEVFDKACEKAEPSYWLTDGVHPTEAGHALITDLWIKKFDEMMK
jgi:lysophospholipase L1-like esterase